jgi:hypothetical protein
VTRDVTSAVAAAVDQDRRPYHQMMGRLGRGLAGQAGLADGAASAARAGYVRGYETARTAGDIEAMAEAALGLAATQTFGTVPGRVPAFLHEAYSLARGEQRARLAVALARAWAYGYDPARAARFVAEALAYAQTHGDPSLLAAALDAQLLVHWGPDDLEERLSITARLEDTVAHVADAEPRMSAHLWRLTTSLECLDLPAVRRQLRALDLLAAESGTARVRFFAASRRGMYALLTGDLDAAERAVREVAAAGAEAGEADALLIGHMLAAGIARQAGDVAALAREAALYEEFGVQEAVPWVAAEAALLWVAAGELDRARALLHQLAGSDFSGIARDLDWLLTVAELTEVSVATGTAALAEAALDLLVPYAGRGVVNGGGAAFAGVISDYLYQASELLGTGDAQQWAARATGEYERLGASWWLHRLPPAVPGQRAMVVRGGGRPEQEHLAVARPGVAQPGVVQPGVVQPGVVQPGVVQPGVVHLRPGGGGIWWVGREGAVTAIRDVKGLHYLRIMLQRPGADIPAIDLSDAVAGHPGAGVVGGDMGEVLDKRALSAYRRRLAEIDADLDEARSWVDTGRAAKLAAERDALLDQVRAATGLGGRPRVPGSVHERARIAVRKAIVNAVDRVAAADPPLGRLLSDTVTTGAICRYDPDPDRPVRWVLSAR